MNATQGDQNISLPTEATHHLSITFNKSTGTYEGVPKEIEEAIEKSGYSIQEVLKNPSLVSDLLYTRDLASILTKKVPLVSTISAPISSTHHLSITYNKDTHKFEGVPDSVREAIAKTGFTDEAIMKDPSIIKDKLYDLNLDEVLANAPVVHDISTPVSATHHVSIRFNEKTGKFEGIPESVREAIKKAGLTEEQIEKNPSLAKDILYNLPLDEVLKDAVVHEISAPVSSTHHVSITLNKETGKFEGIPKPILDALAEAGLTEQQVLNDPSLAKDILYKLNLQEVLQREPSPTAQNMAPGVVASISTPTLVAHHVSIKVNPETGRFEGIPPVILDQMNKEGITLEEVHSDPMLIKDMLYKLDFSLVAGAGKNITVVPSHDVDRPSTLKDHKVQTSLKTADRNPEEFEVIRRLLPRALASSHPDSGRRLSTDQTNISQTPREGLHQSLPNSAPVKQTDNEKEVVEDGNIKLWVAGFAVFVGAALAWRYLQK